VAEGTREGGGGRGRPEQQREKRTSTVDGNNIQLIRHYVQNSHAGGVN
jgi:hypothetical protein